jgi:hypothetical protein
MGIMDTGPMGMDLVATVEEPGAVVDTMGVEVEVGVVEDMEEVVGIIDFTFSVTNTLLY